jgi:hypothetical protein
MARTGVRVWYYGGIVHFWVNHVYYFADGELAVQPMRLGRPHIGTGCCGL